jgi:hypothetical protein
MVSGLGLRKGLTTALNAKLQAALDALAVDDGGGVRLVAGVRECECAKREEDLFPRRAAPTRRCERHPNAARLLIPTTRAAGSGSRPPQHSEHVSIDHQEERRTALSAPLQRAPR